MPEIVSLEHAQALDHAARHAMSQNPSADQNINDPDKINPQRHPTATEYRSSLVDAILREQNGR